MLETALIIANGSKTSQQWLLDKANAASYVAACDGGTNHLKEVDYLPDLFIGDGDSVTEDAVEWLKSNGVRLEMFPADKDETDLELALLEVLAAGYQRIDVAAALGLRVDHELANMMLLSDDRFVGYDIRIVSETQQIRVVRSSVEFKQSEGHLLSLIPVHGEAKFRSTKGLKWGLNNDSLLPGPARGVSNEIISAMASIELEAGVVLAIQTRTD